MRSRLSVCIPTFNGAAFLEAALASVLAQGWEDFELLVVDDGSTDATVEVARSFTDPRLRIHCNEQRLGIPGNWNRCCGLAAGEFICLFHQDDVMLPGNLERKVGMLAEDPEIGFVHSAVELVVEAPMAVTGNWMERANHDFVADKEIYFRKLLLHGNLICAPAVIARRQHLLDCGPFDEELGYAPDYQMWMRMSVESRVGFLCQPLVQYHWHQSNASHAYQFARGREEVGLARQRAVQFYVERTGRGEEGAILMEAVAALAILEGTVMELGPGMELERAKVWLEEQRSRWQKVAEEQRKILEEQQAVIEKLESGKEWLANERTKWQEVAEEQNRLLAEQRERIGELERGKASFESERARRQKLAKQRRKRAPSGTRKGAKSTAGSDSGSK